MALIRLIATFLVLHVIICQTQFNTGIDISQITNLDKQLQIKGDTTQPISKQKDATKPISKQKDATKPISKQKQVTRKKGSQVYKARYTQSISYHSKTRNLTDLQVYFVKFTQNCDFEKCYVIWIQKAKIQEKIIQGFPLAKQIPPIFIFKSNTYNDYTVSYIKSISAYWRNYIFKVVSKFNPFRKANKNLQTQQNTNQNIQLKQFPQISLKAEENYQLKGQDYITQNTQNIQLNMQGQISDMQSKIFPLFKITIEGKWQFIGSDNLTPQKENTMKKVLLKYQNNFFTRTSTQIQNQYRINIKNNINKITKALPYITNFIDTPFPGQNSIQSSQNLFDQDLMSSNKKKIIKSKSDMFKFSQTLLDTQIFKRMNKIQFDSKCEILVMTQHPPQIYCQAKFNNLFFSQSYLINVYNYQRPLNVVFNYFNQVKNQQKISFQQKFPQIQSSIINSVAILNYQVKIKNTIKNLENHNLEIINIVELFIDISTEVCINFDQKLKVCQTLKGSLSKSVINTTSKVHLQMPKFITHSTNLTIQSQKINAIFGRHYSHLVKNNYNCTQVSRCPQGLQTVKIFQQKLCSPKTVNNKLIKQQKINI